jgi:serine/threonine protein kinase
MVLLQKIYIYIVDVLGTYVYMAPEVIRCEPYTEKCDVYSFSIIPNELITAEHPYVDTSYRPSKVFHLTFLIGGTPRLLL